MNAGLNNLLNQTILRVLRVALVDHEDDSAPTILDNTIVLETRGGRLWSISKGQAVVSCEAVARVDRVPVPFQLDPQESTELVELEDSSIASVLPAKIVQVVEWWAHVETSPFLVAFQLIAADGSTLAFDAEVDELRVIASDELAALVSRIGSEYIGGIERVERS